MHCRVYAVYQTSLPGSLDCGNMTCKQQARMWLHRVRVTEIRPGFGANHEMTGGNYGPLRDESVFAKANRIGKIAISGNLCLCASRRIHLPGLRSCRFMLMGSLVRRLHIPQRRSKRARNVEGKETSCKNCDFTSTEVCRFRSKWNEWLSREYCLKHYKR